MGFISLKKLSEQTKIDFYQLEKYIKYMGFDVTEENKIKSVNLDIVDTIETFLKKYSTNEISYMISHNIPYNFEGTLLLNLRKKYNLNEKQFKSKCVNADLEFKYVYNDEECKKFDDFMNQKLNKAELRDLKYIKEGWIPLRDVIKEFGEKYDLCENTASSILDYLKIEIYKPLRQLSFISEEQKKQFEDFLKQFNSSNERKLYLQEQTCIKKYGVKNPSQSDFTKEKISEKLKLYASTTEGLEKIRNAQKLTNLEFSQERKNKGIKTKLLKYGTLSFKTMYEYDNLKFDSSWELYFYIYYKEILNKNIQKGKIFEYKYDNEIHRYECDFLIDNENYEIKSNRFISDKGNLTQMPNAEWNKSKQKCMEENNVRIISKEEIKPIIKIVDEKYTSDYVNLFKKDLLFPYPNEDFRNGGDMGIIRHFHKSIYHARRKKELSPFEAWRDKNLVKKCALNRLKYVGSCRPNDIVQGFNVAKIAPKVSVFDSKLAEDLIKKYLSDVKCIFDPFSGFSGRMIGAFRCDKIYYGKDINKTHVQESNKIISYLHGESSLEVQQEDIFNANVRDFLGLKNKYALFTCSPYEDKESWNENDKNLTCDEWIDVCMKKYKLHKYLFVVDDTKKYKDFIVEILENKSHFGKNNEYVILIENN